MNQKKVILQKLKMVKIEEEKLEKYVEEILNEEENMKNIFPDLIFVLPKFSFWDNLQDKEQIVDAVAFHIKEKFLVVFEYKKGRKKDHIDQARTYFNGLVHEWNGDARGDLKELVNKKLKKRGLNWEVERKNFKSKIKMICLSPSFFERQITGISSEEKKIIIPIKIELYSDGFNEYLYINELQNKGTKLITSGNLFRINEKLDEFAEQPSQETENIDKVHQKENINNFLNELEVPREIKKIVLKINNFLEKEFSMMYELFGKSKNHKWIKYLKNSEPFLSLLPRQNCIRIFLNKLTNDNFNAELIDKYQLEDYREIPHNAPVSSNNDYRYTVKKSENEPQEVFNLLSQYLKNHF
ncbi:protein of unknown function [endosymbiont DhMRE of Dentiscutata heterogama]|uniref:hypothetical protein n=1 Tax=endosymbiont DhMRE of Dentiscutata heterogama TaxID=1609546 RepID=UPI000629D468|nr:hypothetical protein [endosymbiont DhMRE of Dentiscutata heterogama]CFW93034.1 protein of unknown function [endosymbiont DhMRE of Dentiscutata heterogama]